MEIQKLLTTKELAKYLGIGESTLLQYRFDGTGPAYIKLGHLVGPTKLKNFVGDIWAVCFITLMYQIRIFVTLPH